MGKSAVITGATSGLGSAFARKLASLGFNLLLTGRRKEIIEPLAEDLAHRTGVEIEVVLGNLEGEDDLREVVAAVKKREDIEYLINNAGFGINLPFLESSLEREKEMIKVHVIAPLELIHAVIPGMIKNNRGHIINVSSLAAFLPAIKNCSYSGTKSFLTLFSESLHLELVNKGIKVQALCPGFIRTDFHQRVDFAQGEWERLQRYYWMKPEDVVDTSLSCLKKNQVICIPGFLNQLGRRLISVIPRKLLYKLLTASIQNAERH
jgi:short-subunit dehydrogenase